MYFLSPIFAFLLLSSASFSFSAPLPQEPGSLESTPGPYTFEPAPVPQIGSLESTPGPYTFEPAPVNRR